MTFGKEWGWGSDEGQSRKVFDAYIERGGNSIDTANFYTNGTSEKLVGKFMKGRREEIVLATKYTLSMKSTDPNAGGNHRKNLVQSVEASLKRLATSHIDLLWIHAWEFRTPVDEVMRALDDLVRMGKVLYIGVSNAPAWKISQANELADRRGWTPFVATQMHYNLIERAVEREIVPMSLEFDIGMFPWSPLAAGVLTGKYNSEARDSGLSQSLRRESQEKGIKQSSLDIAAEVIKIANEVDRSPSHIALNWLLQKPNVVSPIIGARTLEQLEDNLGSLDFILGDDHVTRLDKISRIELGYPHDFLGGDKVDQFISGGTQIEKRRP